MGISHIEQLSKGSNTRSEICMIVEQTVEFTLKNWCSTKRRDFQDIRGLAFLAEDSAGKKRVMRTGSGNKP
jgi:hypothetical protein